MGQRLRRETFIALRARKTAYRVAAEILHARKVVQAAPEQAWLQVSYEPAPTRKRWWQRTDVRLAIVLWLIALLWWLVLWTTHGQL